MSNAELDVVRRAQQGDESAFDELYKIFYKQAYYLALKITNCDADAKDATQETFITIQKSIKDLREVKTFRKWMAQIVISKCNKIFRKNKYTVLDPDIVNAMPIEENRTYMTGKQHVEAVSLSDTMMKLMMNLTSTQREILVLMYFQQLSIKEIAEILHIPIGTVKSRLTSAKAAMKRSIDQVEGSESIKFHVCPLPILFLLAFKKEFASLYHTKPPTSYLSFIRGEPFYMGTLISLAGVSVVSYMTYQHIEAVYEKDIIKPITYSDETGTYNQKELYEKLREWAHCHVEMEQKTHEEYEIVLPYYEFLKELNGPYYERLQLNHWANDFEKYKK